MAAMKILVLNAGSSSLKFRLIEVVQHLHEPGMVRTHNLIGGAVTGIGGRAVLRLSVRGESTKENGSPISDHAGAVRWVLDHLSSETVDAVGHRVVHGGERFLKPVMIDGDILKALEALNELAPLHNPAAIAGIRAVQTARPTVPMVAVFDTAFHHTLPPVSTTYAIPHDLASRHRIRRYGFHGIAHASMAEICAPHIGRSIEELRLITLVLGNGCSATAIRHGQSVDTSMGFTPLEGLVMGTRSGDLDPAIVGYLARRERVPVEEVERWLNERSGLLGISGLSHDMEVLLAAEERGDSRAALAIELFCYRVRKYIGAYLAVLDGADAIVFGGGIGENSSVIRSRICQDMAWCGLRLNPKANAAADGLSPGITARISEQNSKLEAYVAAVDEESCIAKETAACVHEARSGFVRGSGHGQ